MSEQKMEEKIRKYCAELADFLVEKDKSYGSAITEPLNIFAEDMSPIDIVNVRLDDKVKRIMYGNEYPNDDTPKDFIGYYLFKLIMLDEAKKQKEWYEEE